MRMRIPPPDQQIAEMNDLSRQDPDYVVGMAPISAYPKRATGWGIGATTSRTTGAVERTFIYALPAPFPRSTG